MLSLSHRKRLIIQNPEMEDDDAFLYGDDNQEQHQQPEQLPRLYDKDAAAATAATVISG